MKPIHAEESCCNDRVDEVDDTEEVLELSLDELSHVAGGFAHSFLK